MEIIKGKKGLKCTFQENFKPTKKCWNCKGNCRIMFVACEWNEKKGQWLADMYNNTGGKKGGKYWVHDACAVAVYLCEKCFECNAEINQA